MAAAVSNFVDSNLDKSMISTVPANGVQEVKLLILNLNRSMESCQIMSVTVCDDNVAKFRYL
jgi:hypothetical protein